LEKPRKKNECGHPRDADDEQPANHVRFSPAEMLL
jgi:hypothetical protein